MDAVASVQDAKAWQNWSIIFFIILIGDLISNILSIETTIQLFFVTMFVTLEMCWRLFVIYKVGLYINDLLEKIPSTVPTVLFFGVQIPAPQVYPQDLLEKHVENESNCNATKA